MKLFKETPVNDGYKTLQDYYIYQAKAVSMRYKFLLNCAKRLNEV